jgi:hypothetical protein
VNALFSVWWRESRARGARVESGGRSGNGSVRVLSKNVSAASMSESGSACPPSRT